MRITGLIIAALLAGAACGSTPGPSTTAAVIAVTANPTQVTGALCAGCGAGSTDREALTTVTVQESAGVAGAVTRIDMSLRETGTGAVIASGSFDAGGITQLAGTNRVAARGSLNIRCGVHYAAGQAGKSATLTYTILFTDDRGNQMSQSVSVSVTT